MRHLSDDELVLLFYREGDGVGSAGAHVATCAACRERLDRLAAALGELDSPAVPARDESYGARVWAKLLPRLEAEPVRAEPHAPRRWMGAVAALLTWPRLAAGGALAALLLAAFLAGRWSGAPGRPAAPAEAAREADAPSDAARERVLLAAVGDHLDRSRVVLTEIAHLEGGAADIAPEQATAADLVADNRLYRQAAALNGDQAVAAVLEDLERVLVEIASSPAKASREDLARWREQIDAEGLLFKVTVMSSRVRDRQQGDAPAGGAAKSSI